jgi:hypothetical protein
VDRPRGAGVAQATCIPSDCVNKEPQDGVRTSTCGYRNPTSDKRRAQLLLLGLRRGRIVASLLNFLGLRFGGRPTWGFRGRLLFSLFSIRAAYQEGH